MTREVRNFISPADVVAVEFECLECNSRITLTVDNYKHNPMNCPTCNATWIKVHGGSVDTAVSNMVEYLKEVADYANNKDIEIGATIRLEIADDPISASAHASSDKD